MQIFTAENSMPKFENDDAVLESSDLLKTRYPAFADKIQRAREAGFDDDSIYKRMADHEAEALLSHPAAEVNRMAGRTEESMKLADRIERKQKRDAYVEIYKDKLKEEDVDDRMRAAEVLSVSPVVFLRNDDLYKRMSGHIKVRESYLETVGNAIRGNELQGANANIGMRMIWGEDSPELWAQVESNDAELEKLALPVDRKFGQEGLSGAVDMVMQMASGARRGLPYAATNALAGAGFALAAGQAGPQALVPEEILTVPGAVIAGASVGISTGMVAENFSREAGSAMLEFSSMIDEQGNPMDRDAARGAAFLVGLINTGIEQLQMERIVKSVPGGEKLFSKMTAPMVRKLLEIPAIRSTLSKAGGRIVDVGKGYVADTTVETIQEVLQETVTILCGRLGVALSGQEYAPLDLGESIDRLAETGSSSAKAMSVLFAPGAAMRGVGALRSRVKGDSKSPLPPVAGETGELSDSSSRSDVVGENRVEEIGEKIFLPAEAIERYNQDNPGALDTIEVHPQPIEGTDEVMVTAKELDRLKQDAPDLVDSIRGDIRLGADGKTVSELGESVVEKIERESERPEIQKQIAQEIEEKAISAGRPKSEAKVMGKISSSFAMEISRLTGISPQDAVKLDMRKAVFDEVDKPGSGSFSQSDITNAQVKLDGDVAAWEKTVDQFLEGKLHPRHTIQVMTTPLAFHFAGAEVLPVSMRYDVLEKILHTKHNIPSETLKQLPGALADPIMIFDSATTSGSLVAMVELTDPDGATIVVPLRLNKRQGRYEIYNEISSAYGRKQYDSQKPNDQWFVNQVKEGRLRYVNTQKSSAWLDATGLYLPGGGVKQSFLNQNIPTEADLVKARTEHPGYYQQNQRQPLDSSYFAAVEAGNTKKSANWARGCGLQLPIMPLPAEALSNSNIPTEADLVKARTENPGYYQDSATPNARLEIFPDGHSLISFFETANKSTSFHEFAHHMFRMMVDLRDVPGADAQFKADVDTVFREAGVSLEAFQNDSAARTEVHEFFARGFETYLSEGKAPTKALRGAFKRLRAWLIGVYRDVVASLGIELSDPMRDVYARLLAAQEDIDRETTINHLAAEMIALKKEIKARSEEMRKAESEAIEFERAPLDDLKARQKEIRQGMKDKALRREVNDRILESLKEKQRARKALKKEVNRLVSEINRMARIKVISWGKQQSIKKILTGYDLKRRQQKTMERRADLEKYLNENPEAVNDFHEDDVKFLGVATLNDMTLGELQDLHRKVGEEYKQGRREYATWEAEKRERADGIQLGLLESLKKKSPKVAKVKKGTEDVGKQYKGPVGAVEKVADWERSALLGPDRFFDWLDGGGTSYVGTFVQNFVDKMNDCKNSELLHVGERTQKMAEALRDLGLKVGEFGKKIMTIEGVDFTYDEAMEVYVGMANEKKRAAILHGVLNGLSDPEAAATRLINALDDPHRKAAWLVVEDHDRNVDRIDEIMVRTFNRGMVREKNYTSIHRLEHIAKGQLIDEDMELAMLNGESAAGVMQRIEDGFTQARVTISEENQAPIKLGLYSNWHTDVARQEHLAAFAGHTKDLASAMMMRDPETGQTLGQMVKERFGDQAWKTLMDNFNVNVTDQKQVGYELMDGLVSKVTRNMAISYLGINFGTAIKQLTSLPRFAIALTTIAGPKHFMAAISEFLLKGPRFLDEIYSMDPQLKERKGNALFEGMRYAPNVSERFKKYVDASLYPISLMDRWVAAIGWKAVYNAKIESMGKVEAAREAQRVVRLTQQAAHVKDTARLWRQSGVIRLGMIFTSDAASVLGMVTYDFVEQLRTKQWNKLMGTTVAIVLPAILMKAVVDGLPDEDDDEKYGEWISSALTEQALTSVPLIGRELVNIYDTRFQGKYWGGQYSPMATPFDKLARASTVLTDEDADDKARTKAIWDGLEGLSLMGTGIPITGIRRLVQFNGIAEEEGMGNAVKSLVGMKRKKE